MSTDHSRLTSAPGSVRPPPAPTLPLSGRDAFPTVPQESLPQAIGKYQVQSRIGAGAMGVAYLCSQPGLDRPVVVKVLLAARHASSEQVLRFQREARAAARLTH